MDLQPGDIFEGDYEIVGQLGTGGQSNVYRASHVVTGRRVAIKLLHHGGDGVRFIREGRVVSRLKSPHTVRLISFDRAASGQFYMIFEFVPGEDLGVLCRREAPFEWSFVARLMRQVLEALSEAHGLGIIHRDIKPSNIMVTPNGDAKVLDFGVARIDEGDSGKNLTATGEVLGTPRYVSPEALNGSKVTAATDVYAVGLVAWEMLVGRPANDARSGADIVLRHLDATPYRLPLELAISDDARRWVSTMCNKIPERRPKDAAEALVDLDAFETPPPPLVAQDAPTGQHSTYDDSLDSVETRVLGDDDDDDHPAPLARAATLDETPVDPTDPEPWRPPDITDPTPWVPAELVAASEPEELDVQLELLPAPPPPQMRSAGLPPVERRAFGMRSRPVRVVTPQPPWTATAIKALVVIAVLAVLATIWFVASR